MATPDMSSELADLREQLHQLELERAKELKPAASATKAAETEPDDLVAEKATEAGNWFEELEELEAEEELADEEVADEVAEDESVEDADETDQTDMSSCPPSPPSAATKRLPPATCSM